MAVQRIVGSVEVEDDLLGRRAMRLQEQIDKKRFDRRRVMADLVIARRNRARQFEPVQGRLAGDRRAIAPPRCKLARKNRDHRIAAKLVVVVEVLIAQRQAKNPLADKRGHAMLDQIAAPPILETTRQAIDKPDRPVSRPKQKPAGVRGERTAVKIGDHRAPFNRCKPKRICATLRRHRGDLPILLK